MNYPKFSLLFLATSAFAANVAIAKDKQPNILFIMSDDHTWQAIGAYQTRLAALNPTPNIDRIADEGVVMDRAFCTNSISTPSRANIISGQYSQTNGILILDEPIDSDHVNLPREMNQLGYETAIIGKWHLTTPPNEFDYFDVLHGQGEFVNPKLFEKGETDSLLINYMGKKMRPARVVEGHCSDVLTDRSINWLENIRDKSKPFMLCHHFKAPHSPYIYHERYSDFLEGVHIPEPASMYYNEEHGSVATKGYHNSLIDTIGASVSRRNAITMVKRKGIDSELSDKEYTHKRYQEMLRSYLRCARGVDDNVGRLLHYLEDNDLLENTIIIYTGDQGIFLGEHDFVDKRWMYDPSLRMPLLIRYPKKIEKGTHCGAIVNNVDFAPTMIDMAGGKTPKYMHGESFKDILYSGVEPESWKKSTYYRHWMHMANELSVPAHFGVRTKDYKLIFFYGINYNDYIPPRSISTFQTPAGWELYDLRNDPDEMKNVYGNPAYAKVTAELKNEILRLREKYDETDEKYPAIQKIIDENWDK